MRRALIVFDLACLLAFAACATVHHFDVPYNVETPSDSLAFVVHYDPPPVYRTWWRDVEICSHTPRPQVAFEQVQWFMVGSLVEDGASQVMFRAFRWHGQWVYALHDAARVVNVLISAPVVMDARIVRHEMLHVITSPTRYEGHPDSLFRQGPCARLVYTPPKDT